MGNPLIVWDPDELPQRPDSGDDFWRHTVFSVTPNPTELPVQVRPQDGANVTNDVSPNIGSDLRPLIVFERIGTTIVEEDGATLNYRPPFISEDVWWQVGNEMITNDAVKGGPRMLSSMGTVVNNVLIPFPLMPNMLMNQNGCAALGLTGCWDWQVFINGVDVYTYEVDKYITREASAKKEKLFLRNIATDENGQVYENVSYTLDLTTDDTGTSPHTINAFYYKENPNDTQAQSLNVNPLLGTADGGRLGSFAVLLQNIKPVGNTAPIDNKNDSTLQQAIKRKEKEPSYTITLEFGNPTQGTKVIATLEEGTSLKIKLNGDTTEINCPSVMQAVTGTQELPYLALIFFPVYNGLVVQTAMYMGLNEQALNTTMTLIPLTKGNDPLGNIKSGKEFDVDNPTDIEVEAKLGSNGGAGTLMQMGNSLSLVFKNCSANFAYYPLFFVPAARGEYYFMKTDTSGYGLTEKEMRYMVYPVWCSNGTATKPYPIAFEQEEWVYPTEDGEPKTRAAKLKLSGVTLSATSMTVTEIDEGPTSNPNAVKKKTVTFSVTGDTTNIGLAERVVVTGSPFSDAGKEYNVQATADNYVTVTTKDDLPLGTTALSGVSMTVKERDINDVFRRIAFGLNGGTQLLGRDYEYTVAFNSANYDDLYTKEAWKRWMDCGGYPRYPAQVFGFIFVISEKGMVEIRNGNGDPLFNEYGSAWHPYIRSLSVTHDEAGTTGTMSLDRYGMKQAFNFDDDITLQRFGYLNFDLNYVATAVDQTASSYSCSTGSLFMGFGYGQGVNDSVGGNELSVPLFGMQKKLEELKLINAPYFDGRTLRYVLRYLMEYGNFAVNLDNADPDATLPSSTIISQAMIDFKAGTSVWDAMQMIADHTAHYFVLQPDGIVHWYEASGVNGVPLTDHNHRLWHYPNLKIITNNANPSFEQFYNRVILLAVQANSAGMKNPLDKADSLPMNPLISVADVNTVPEFPWTKAAVIPMDGFWTAEELDKEARRYAVRARSIMWSGSVQIPGNLQVKVFDSFSNKETTPDNDFLITGVTHDVDMSSRSFTTTLQLNLVKPSGTTGTSGQGEIG